MDVYLYLCFIELLCNMEYIVHGSKNQSDSKFKLTLERGLSETNATVSGSSHRQPMSDQDL